MRYYSFYGIIAVLIGIVSMSERLNEDILKSLFLRRLRGLVRVRTTFDALLGTVLSIFLKLLSIGVIIFDIRIGLINLKTQARAKVRASDVRLTFGWSSPVLRSVS